MRILNVHDDPARFFRELASAKRRVLVMDYDHVIAPCSAQESGMPYPTVSELLDCIMTTSRTRVVFITNRRATDLAPLTPGPAPDIWRAGGSPGGDRMLSSMLAQLGEDTAVAFLGDCDQLFTAIPQTTGDVGGDGVHNYDHSVADENEAFVQFLADWLRVCGGEIC